MPLVIAGGIAAAVLALGASGTLSSWTSAVIDNPTNSVAMDSAVILKETDGINTCYSSDGAQLTVNTSTCATVNSYGGTASPLVPGASTTTDVTFTDVGGAAGSGVTLAWGGLRPVAAGWYRNPCRRERVHQR